MRTLLACLCLSLYLSLCATSALADTTGSILGTVTDSRGDVVAGASVTVRQRDTNFTRTGATDEAGNYRFSALPIGPYHVTITAAGFRAGEGEVRLEVGQETRLDAALAVGGEAADFTSDVVASDEITPDTSTVGTVVDNRKITDLPLNGRNFLQLGALIPGVAAAPGGGGSEGGTFVGAFSVGGQRDRGANYQLDGADNNQGINNNAATFVNVDAIQEFSIETSTFSAEYGRNSGAVVNVATRSGTNDFHGTLFEFLRNDAFDARNFFENAGGAPDSKFSLNQFGGVVGGPLRRDRAFFFASYEGTRSRVGNTIFTNVPTLDERLAVTTGVLDGVPVAVDPVAARLLALYPLPNATSSFGNYISSETIRGRNDNVLARVDYNPSERNTFSFRYVLNDNSTFAPVLSTSGTANGSSQVPGYGLFSDVRSQNFAVSWTHLFSSSLVSVGRFAASRFSDLQAGEDHTDPAVYGLETNVVVPEDVALPQILVSGLSGIGNSNVFPFGDGLDTFQFADTVTWTRGPHTLKLGADVRAVQLNGFQDFSFAGTIGFDGSVSGVSPLYDFLQGTPSPQVTFIGRGLTAPPIRQQNVYLFAQDDWAARPGLTLNLGLRYELNTVPTASGRLTNFTVDRGFFTDADGLYAGDFNNFAPRVGFAWTPFADAKTVVRGGAGLFYDLVFGNVPFALTFNPPASVQFYPIYGTVPRPGRLFHVFSSVPLGPDFEDAGPALVTIDPNLRTPYAVQWNLNVQRQLVGGLGLEVGYYATRGVKLVRNRDVNQAVYFPGSSPLDVFDRRPTQLAGRAYLLDGVDTGGIDLVQQQEAAATSIYHSLQARVSGRVRGGLYLLASYTWAHSIDDASDIFGFTGSSGFPQDSDDLAAERADSPFDIRDRFTGSFTWDVPGEGIARGGWQVNGIATAQSGAPFTVRLGTDAALDGNPFNEQRPNDVPGALVPDGRGGVALTVPVAALVPADGAYGTLPRNSFRGPKFVNFDASVFKTFVLGEGLSLQFRTEVFNVFNHPSFALPETNLLSPTFGTFSRTPDVAAGNPRIATGSQRVIQFALKLMF
jgi:outer membrane receptor protein involved in Fe transport